MINREFLTNCLQKANQSDLLKEIEKCNDLQLINLQSYIQKFELEYPGGVSTYSNKIRELLQKEKDLNPIEIKYPSNVVHLEWGQQFEQFENSVSQKLYEVGFVLVAGGMGERLGFPGIKLSITIDLITGKSFLEYYLDYLKSFSLLCKKKMQLLIMTSAQNDAQTKEFIQMRNINHKYYDYVEISFVIQDLPMPSIKNAQGDFQYLYDNKNNLMIEGKPHGHGDVHLLIKNSKILETWKSKGVKAVLFFQDTNPLSLPNTPALYGIFTQEKFKFMFSSIKRKKDEAVGVLVEDKDGKVFNMEYNIFGKLPIAKSEKEFAGNVNLFVIELEEYQRILGKENGGLAQEFINVKKNPITGDVLKTFRLECLMQDISKDVEGKIGVVEQDRSFNFTTTKNNLETGKNSQQKGINSETILECENDVYARNCRLLSYLGVNFEQSKLFNISVNPNEPNILNVFNEKTNVNGIRVTDCPKISIDIELQPTIFTLRQNLTNKFSIKNWKYDQNSKKYLKIFLNSQTIALNKLQKDQIFSGKAFYISKTDNQGI